MKVCKRNKNGKQGGCCVLRVDMYIHSHSERVQACGNQYLYLSLMLHLFAIQVKKVNRYESCFGRPSPKMVSETSLYRCIKIPPIRRGEYYLLFVAGKCLGGRVLAWHKEGFDFLLVSLAPPEKKETRRLLCGCLYAVGKKVCVNQSVEVNQQSGLKATLECEGSRMRSLSGFVVCLTVLPCIFLCF